MRLLALVLLVIAIVVPLAAVQQTTTLKVDVDLVNVLYTVTDRYGHFVPGLDKDDFAVEEDGTKQEIRSFSPENVQPLAIGMLIDTSPSVSKVFGDEKETATNFIETILRAGDKAFVIGFDRDVTLVQDFTDDRRRLREGINSLNVGQGTSVYDAVFLACNELFSKEKGRKALILISDGQDTTSRVRLSEATTSAEKSEPVVYSISNRVGGFFNIKGSGDPETLKRLSSDSGGGVYFVGGRSDLTRVFGQISDELRNQYSLGYVSTNTARDGKFRTIRIIPKDPSLKVRARNGYYAPGQ